MKLLELSFIPARMLLQTMPLNPGHHLVLHAGAPQGRDIEWLYWGIFWVLVAVFVLMIAAFTRASAKSHVSALRPLPVIENDEADRRAGWAVWSALGITVITLFVILVISIVTGKRVEGLTSKNPITVQITGHQWWWEVTYPNSQADQTITTANEIHVPINTPVVVLTNSADVIHSFWAPSITGKRDLLPGYSSAFWFEVDKAGIYRGQCAEFCGLQHAHMGFSVIAEPVDKFDDWKRQQLKPAPDPADAEAARGREVFLTHACLMCHTIRGTDAGSHVGPDLTHVASRNMIAAETLPNTAGALGGWIVDPQRIKPNSGMESSSVGGKAATNNSLLPAGLLKISVYHIRQWPEVAKFWAKLDEVSPYSSFYLSVEWTTAWLEIFGKLLQPDILVFENENKVIGICLLVRSTERRGPFRIKRIYLNTVGGDIADRTVMEFNNLLCLRGWEEKTSKALAAHLQSLDWDEFAVEGIPPGVILDCFRISGFSQLPPTVTTSPCYYVNLEQLRQSKIAYESSLSSNTRDQLRRSLKRYRMMGEVRLEVATELSRAEQLFEEMCGLHQSRWEKKGEEGAFGPGRRLEFHRTLIRRAFAKGGIQLLRVAAGAETIGILYNFVKKGKVYFFQSGFNYRDDERVKPGLVTHSFAIRYCLDAGFSDYDFLAGDAQYKRSLAKDWVVFARPHVKLFAIERLRAIKRRLSLVIKNA